MTLGLRKAPATFLQGKLGYLTSRTQYTAAETTHNPAIDGQAPRTDRDARGNVSSMIIHTAKMNLLSADVGSRYISRVYLTQLPRPIPQIGQTPPPSPMINSVTYTALICWQRSRENTDNSCNIAMPQEHRLHAEEPTGEMRMDERVKNAMLMHLGISKLPPALHSLCGRSKH